MEQLKTLLQILSNLIIGENITYSLIVSIIVLMTAISLMVAVFKFLLLAKEHYNSYKFIKYFHNSTDLLDVLEQSDIVRGRSVLAKAFYDGFRAFYSVYKLNPNYQSGSTIALSTRTMDLSIGNYLNNSRGYSFMLYISMLIPGIAIAAIIYNYSNYIEIYKTFDKIDPKILVDSLRLFFISIVSSLFISTLFILIDKYLENRALNFKHFMDEYALILHKRFYAKEYDEEEIKE